MREASKALFRFLCSLKLAVIVLVGLVGSLAVGTILESVYDTPTAQYWVYRSLWFHAVLALLGINILCVAISRFPWKWRHTPFLLAHLGILILLFGSWLTERYGLDGSLRITEGETSSTVELSHLLFILSDRKDVHAIPIQWTPPGVPFHPFSTTDYGLPYRVYVDQFLPHADGAVSFVPNSDPHSHSGTPPAPAVQFRLAGGPMGISQDFWLWTGEPAWSRFEAGPAVFSISSGRMGIRAQAVANRPTLSFSCDSRSGLAYRAWSSSGHLVSGRVPLNQIEGKTIVPGWAGGMKITLLKWVPDAISLTTYKPSRTLYGNEAPPPAIHLVARGSTDSPDDFAESWLGLGDRITLHLGGSDVDLAFFPERVILPFSIRLDRFTVDRYEGTMDPASYASTVTVLDRAVQQPVTISMNEPLKRAGFTLYQASYEDGQPRPVTSILAVNRDPGRPWKYLGSLFVVFGSVLLFVMKYRRKKAPGLAPVDIGKEAIL